MVASTDCPRCGGTHVWLEENASWIEHGCHTCNHAWKSWKAQETDLQ